jgi:hypothetical protein
MPIALLKEKMPPVYTELHDTVKMLEKHMHDMQASRLLQTTCLPCLQMGAGQLPAAAARLVVGALPRCRLQPQPREPAYKLLSPDAHGPPHSAPRILCQGHALLTGRCCCRCHLQDTEFTVQDGRLFMLQTRNGKRTGPAALRIALDMEREVRCPQHPTQPRTQERCPTLGCAQCFVVQPCQGCGPVCACRACAPLTRLS